MNSPSAKSDRPITLKLGELQSSHAAATEAGLTRDEIFLADKLLERALTVRPIPYYYDEERFALAILAANYIRLQRARGKRSLSRTKAEARYRREHVNLLLRYVVNKRYRKDPTSTATVMEIVRWLDNIGIEASDAQVRRDIHNALKSGPLEPGL
jgi:hypothetical protein